MLRVRTGATDNTLYQQSSRPDHMPQRRVYRRVHQKKKRGRVSESERRRQVGWTRSRFRLVKPEALELMLNLSPLQQIKLTVRPSGLHSTTLGLEEMGFFISMFEHERRWHRVQKRLSNHVYLICCAPFLFKIQYFQAGIQKEITQYFFVYIFTQLIPESF